MTGPGTSPGENRRTKRRMRFVAWWPMLRILIQMCAAAAMLSQQEGLALLIGGVAMLLEIAQDRYTVRSRQRSKKNLSTDCEIPADNASVEGGTHYQPEVAMPFVIHLTIAHAAGPSGVRRTVRRTRAIWIRRYGK